MQTSIKFSTMQSFFPLKKIGNKYEHDASTVNYSVEKLMWCLPQTQKDKLYWCTWIKVSVLKCALHCKICPGRTCVLNFWFHSLQHPLHRLVMILEHHRMAADMEIAESLEIPSPSSVTQGISSKGKRKSLVCSWITDSFGSLMLLHV